MKFLSFPAALLACLALSPFTAASAAEPQQVITSSVEGFASEMQTDGNTLVVGAQGETVNGIDRQGAAYVYEFIDGQWLQTAKLLADDGAERDSFATEVAVEGNVIAVAASLADADGVGEAGKVYVFEREDESAPWVQTAMLTAPEPVPGTLFGTAITVDGNRIAVAAPNDQRAYRDLGGATYIFERDAASGTWKQAARLERERVGGGDATRAVDISGDLLALGTGVGTVFIYEFDGTEWQPDHAFRPGRGVVSVRLDGDVLAVGVPSDVWSDREWINVGRVHVHERNSDGVWKEAAIFEAPEPATNGNFGASMDMQDGLIAATSGHLAEPLTSLFMKDAEGEWMRVYDLEGFMPPFSRHTTVSARTLFTGGSSAEAGNIINVFDAAALIASSNVPDGSAGVTDGDEDKYTGDGTNNDFSSVIPVQPQVLERSDTPEPNDNDRSLFGSALDTVGDYMVIGAPLADAAYVFVSNDGNWEEVAKLVAPGAVAGERFGDAVVLGDGFIAVSAPDAAAGGVAQAGAVHVFERGASPGEWSHAARLECPDPVTGAGLGVLLDADGEYVIASVADAGGGAACLFSRDAASGGWAMERRFAEAGGGPTRAVAVSNDTLAIAAGDNVFIHEDPDAGWPRVENLEAPFVVDIALEDGVLAVGAPSKSIDARGRGEGVVDVYERRGASNWMHVAALASELPVSINGFGTAVDLQDGLLVANENHQSGGVFLFQQTVNGDWTRFHSLYMGRLRDAGHESAISADVLAVGVAGAFLGVVFVHDMADLLPAPVPGDVDGDGDPGNDDPGNGNGDPRNGNGNGDPRNGNGNPGNGNGGPTGTATGDNAAGGGGGGGGGSLAWLIGFLAAWTLARPLHSRR